MCGGWHGPGDRDRTHLSADPASSAADLTCRLQRTLPGIGVRPLRPPLCPELELLLIDPEFPRAPLAPAVASAVMAEPAYWAFCWASGQALARLLLDQPERVAGQRVLDLGSGSGVVGIAAALAGAAHVIACDTDADARAATAANARRNGVRIETIADLDELGQRIDLILIADLFYDLANHGLAARLPQLADDVLIADSRLKTLPVPGYRQVHAMHADTIPDLDESPEFRHVRVYAPDRD